MYICVCTDRWVYVWIAGFWHLDVLFRPGFRWYFDGFGYFACLCFIVPVSLRFLSCRPMHVGATAKGSPVVIACGMGNLSCGHHLWGSCASGSKCQGLRSRRRTSNPAPSCARVYRHEMVES